MVGYRTSPTPHKRLPPVVSGTSATGASGVIVLSFSGQSVNSHMTNLSLSSLDSKSMRFGYVVFAELHSLKKSTLTGSIPHKWGDHITALALGALGGNAHAPQRRGMTDTRHRQPASDDAPHAIPEDSAVLASPRQQAMPEPIDSESKNRQRRLVRGHSVISKVSTHNRPQPLALFGDGLCIRR